MAAPYAPRDLGQAGRRLWRSAVAQLGDQLGTGDRVILGEACKAADLCARLAARADSSTSRRADLVELRLQRAALAALVAQLKI